MTAVAGLWWFDRRADLARDCARMLASQEMYGRHGVSQWSDGTLALGRRLTKILPEDVHDRQPLIGGGGRYVLVADLRLDNRNELLGALRIPSIDAQGLSDAAILLAGVERWGGSIFEHLVGDYAFALWDSTRKELQLARDPLGQRPLYYHHCDNFVAFASMPKGLHALPHIPYAPDEEHIAELLVLMPPMGRRSFFCGIDRVEPGHVVTVATSGLTTRRHWHPPRRRLAFRRSEDYCEALKERLEEAVQCRLRGDGNVAAHLSGGLDSPAVAATAARLLATSGRRVVAFTTVPRRGYNGPEPRNRFINEGEHAAATAALYENIDHVLVDSIGRSPLDDLDRSFLLTDEPITNICLVGGFYSIYDAASARNLKILLGGEFGNFGFSYHGLGLLPELIRSGRWIRWWQEARALVRPGGMRWRGVFANTFGAWCPAKVWVFVNKLATGYRYEISSYSGINPRRLAEFDIQSRAKLIGMDGPYRTKSDSFKSRLAGLRKSDAGSYYKGILGGWQIDYRDPTADIRLLEFCLSVPTEQFLRDGVNRSLARRALADRLPKMVVNETRKGLQAPDWHERLSVVRDRVARELDRLGECPLAAKSLDLHRLRMLVENWPSGNWESDKIINSYRNALLHSIAVGHFLRRVSGANI